MTSIAGNLPLLTFNATSGILLEERWLACVDCFPIKGVCFMSRLLILGVVCIFAGHKPCGGMPFLGAHQGFSDILSVDYNSRRFLFLLYLKIKGENDMTTNKKRVWLITGASKGLGYAFTCAALAAGDRVAAVSRTTDSLQKLQDDYPDTLLTLSCDVTDRKAVFETVEKAAVHFGRIDIAVNNAGIMTLGMVEEISEAAAQQTMDTNFFGVLWISQAVLPWMRKQQSGHIIQISSIGALVTGPMAGIYSASKFALEGLSEALAQEVADFGIKLTIVEPGGYWTNLYLSMQYCEPMEAYDPLRKKMERDALESVDSEPALAADALMKLVNSKKPPLRLILGGTVYEYAKQATQARLQEWQQWEELCRSAEHAVPPPPGYGEA